MIWDQENVRQRVRRLREEKGWSQAQLGGHADLSERSINRIETVISHLLGQDLRRIAKALGVTESYLMNGDSHADRQTFRLIDEARQELGITPDEESRLKELACQSIRQRNNAKIPLNRSDLKSLLEVIRG